ncbi:MAG: glucose-6-phosphate isomerase family protein [Armatimonadota bacterium]
MKDLTPVSGLPLKFDLQCLQFAFGPEVRDPFYGTRSADQIRKVLLDPDCELPEIIYWMLRDLGRKDLPDYKQTDGLRYDVSIFRGDLFGREFMKTSGHYHPVIPGGSLAWPEVYEIVDGKALYVLQKVNSIELGPDEVVVEDVIIVEGFTGDKVIMPPDYGHVTINDLQVPFVMSNWVSSKFSSVYRQVEASRGFAYYYLHGDGSPRWVKNPAYEKPLPPLRKAIVKEVPALGLTKATPLFDSCVADPSKFLWLNDPASFMDEIWSGLEIVGEVEVGEM